MPQVDVQWPSENEDFDATADNSSTKTATKVKPSLAKIADNESEPEEAPTADASEAEVPVSGSEEAKPVEVSTEEAPAAYSENQPNPNPVVENEAAALASSVDNDPGAISQIPVASKSKWLKMPAFNFNKGILRLSGEAVLVLAVLALGLWSWNLYNDRKNLQNQVASLSANPQSAAQKQTQQLINKVGSLMQLPTGETPTVAAVSNASQAKQQSSFFASAQNGDRVLMYVKAGEAILYRPSTNKIILVAPLVFSNSGTTSSSTNKSTSTTTTPTSTGTTSSKSTTTGN